MRSSFSRTISAGAIWDVSEITLLLPNDAPREPATHEPGWRELSAGLRFVFGSPLLIAAMLLDLLAVLLGGATYLIPVLADRLGVSSIGY